MNMQILFDIYQIFFFYLLEIKKTRFYFLSETSLEGVVTAGRVVSSETGNIKLVRFGTGINSIKLIKL